MTEDLVAGLICVKAKLLARNWRPRGGGEVDIVALEGDTLLFLEVKSRKKGRPRSLVTRAQKRRLLRSVDLWLAKSPHEGPVRLEMVLVTRAIDGSVERVDRVPLS